MHNLVFWKSLRHNKTLGLDIDLEIESDLEIGIGLFLTWSSCSAQEQNDQPPDLDCEIHNYECEGGRKIHMKNICSYIMTK